MRLRSVALLVPLFLVSMLLPASFLAQNERVRIDQSLILAEAENVNSFIPKGWKIEEQVTGDLNGDSLPDYALKLVEDKPAKKGDVANDRDQIAACDRHGAPERDCRAGKARSDSSRSTARGARARSRPRCSRTATGISSWPSWTTRRRPTLP